MHPRWCMISLIKPSVAQEHWISARGLLFPTDAHCCRSSKSIQIPREQNFQVIKLYSFAVRRKLKYCLAGHVHSPPGETSEPPAALRHGWQCLHGADLLGSLPDGLGCGGVSQSGQNSSGRGRVGPGHYGMTISQQAAGICQPNGNYEISNIKTRMKQC